MFQNTGEKGTPQREAEDVPRRRANNRRGLGTRGHERPPIQGVVGRTSGQIRLTVGETTQQQPSQPQVERATSRTAAVSTDESSAYNQVRDTGRTHHPVGHSPREYARDDDGDGVREVHDRFGHTHRNQACGDALVGTKHDGFLDHRTRLAASPLANSRTCCRPPTTSRRVV